MLTIKSAMATFIEGWVHSRRMAGEITLTNPEPLTHLRFGNTPAAIHEFMVSDTPPDEVIHLIRLQFPALPHLLSVFTNDVQANTDAFSNAGYQILPREYLMARGINAPHLAATRADINIQRITSGEDRNRFNAAHQHEVVPPHALTDSRMGYYFIWLENDLVCEGRSIQVDATSVVIDSVRTHSAYRRRGLAAALMQVMLRDAADRGAKHSVLVASEDGCKLYLTLGYQVISPVLIFEMKPADLPE